MKNRLITFLRIYVQNKSALFGLLVIVFITLIGILAPVLAPFSPTKISSKTLSPPDDSSIMGTDNLGRDILSRFLFGARVSLLVAFLVASLSTILGLIIGAFAGYYAGKKIDMFLSRIIDTLLVFPTFFVAMFTLALFGSGLINLILVMAILSWPSTARLVRAEFLSMKESSFVEALNAIGVSKFAIIFLEIMPNVMAPAIINGSLQAGWAILTEAGLSFIGLGDPTLISWGQMLRGAQDYFRFAWWTALFPGMGILFTVLGINLVGDGVNDALNPKLEM